MPVSGQRIPHPPSTHFDEESESESEKPVAKRLKWNGSPEKLAASTLSPSLHTPEKQISRQTDAEIPDSEEEEDYDDDQGRTTHYGSTTNLESVLPSVRTDREAIEDYELARAAENESTDGIRSRLDRRKWARGRNSIYVDAFNLALNTVLDEESHLFDALEQEVFAQWRMLSYPAQFLYVRLFLRKAATWHRIGRLGYHSDIADLQEAAEELQKSRSMPCSAEAVAPIHPGELETPDGVYLTGDAFSFADASSEHITTMEEASSLLSLEELKLLAKDVKAQGKNKKELLAALRRTSQTQGGLAWKGLKRSDTEDSTNSVRSETSETFDNSEANRDSHFVRKILEGTTGECIRLSKAAFKLFERVHLVFYRSTEWTDKSLTAIILAGVSKRNYPEYVVARSANIFEDRAMLLEFEASLRTQWKMDNILEFNGKVTDHDREVVKQLGEAVYPRWLTLLTHELLREKRVYDSGEGAYLRRFSPAWVYTRIIHKSLDILGRNKEHERERGLLVELLDQTLFHLARRGAWYQRKALLEEHYMWKIKPSHDRSEEAQRRHWREIALRTCEQGLQDPDTHLIYHHDLQRRLVKLERALRIPKRLQHDFGHALLAQPVERTIKGIRLQKRAPSTQGRSTPTPLSRRNSSPGPGSKGPSTRTLWLDSGDSEGAVSVEEFTLTHYRKEEGWKGLHTEGGILRTLFGLLFQDIIFAYVPGVFQTAFQTAPLDLWTDSFFTARRQALEHRFVALSNGAAPAMLAQSWDAHAAKQTCIVGVRWDYERADLLEIAECFPGDGLAAICRVLAQEYAQRGGGVPDLFLWRPARGNAETEEKGKGEVMFVEVKSENDRLSDTQRLWIHVITDAGVRVEVCHVLASDVQMID